MMNVTGRTALVTGASSGLGLDFARELAQRGCNLVLVARREALLTSVQQDIAGTYGVAVDTVTMDLVPDEAPQHLYDQLKAAGTAVDVLVNNAGFGLFGRFVDIPWEREKNMLQLDMITLTHLTKLFARDMVERGFGYILQVASIGAYQPTPTYATYSAAKSYVLSFGEALNYELRGTGVHCTVVSPGITATEFHEVAGQKLSLYQRLVMMTSEEVARIGIKSLLKGKPSVVPGFVNAASAWSTRLVPRRLSTTLAYHLMTK